MKTPINSILEEFVSDVGLALGMEWRYQYQNYHDNPDTGLEIQLSIYGILVSGAGQCGEEVETITYGISDKNAVIDWDVLRYAILYFYRLIGQHVLPEAVLKNRNALTKFATGMTRSVLTCMQEDKVVVMSFKDGRNDLTHR